MIKKDFAPKKNMKKWEILNALFAMAVVFFSLSCSKNTDEDIWQEEIENSDKPNSDKYKDVVYQNNVVDLDNLSIDSIKIIDEHCINVYTKQSFEDNLSVGDIVVYHDTLDCRNFFTGKIISYSKGSGFLNLKTEIPAFQDVFKDLDVSPEITIETSSVEYIPDENDPVKYIGLVDNNVWDDIEVLYQENTEVDSKAFSRANRYPIDVTLGFKATTKNAFSGNVYLRLTGSIFVEEDGSYELSVTEIIGLKGSLDIASASKERTYIPILSLKNALTIYSNKIVGVKLKPSFNFYYTGGIKLEAGFNYEIMNADVYSSYKNGELYSKSFDNKRDAYFRVKSLHTEGEFGFSLNNDLYAFIFTDKFFAGGVNVVGGVGVGGENNVGIQFPDFVNFDFKVYFKPFLEIKPFVALKLKELKRYEGPTFSVESEKFTVNLLPDIHDLNYKRKSKQLNVSSSVETNKVPVLQTKEAGIALFEANGEKPIGYSKIDDATSRAVFDDIQFAIASGIIYEIAPYAKTEDGEEVYGNRVEVQINPWAEFYDSTNGDDWTNNLNWCSNKDILEWYGVSQGEFGLNLNLANNNLSGDAVMYDLYFVYVDIFTGNKLNSLKIEKGFIGNLNAYNTKLNDLTIKNGGTNITSANSLEINNVIVEDGSLEINGDAYLNNVTIKNCGNYINLVCSGNILTIENQNGGCDIRGNWNKIIISGGGGSIKVYGSIGRFICPYRGGGTCLNGTWNDYEKWK